MKKQDWWYFLHDRLVAQGISDQWAIYLNVFVLLVLSSIFIFLIDFIIWKILQKVSVGIAKKTKTNFDNFAVANRLPRFLAHILPLVLALELTPFVFYDFQYAGNAAFKFLNILGLLLVLRIARSLLRTVRDYLKTLSQFRDKPIDSYIQVFMIFAWASGTLSILAIITDTDIWKFFTGLGAVSAILLLIFRDTILGFVASIQVSINDMVRIGDWITFEKYGADGDVTEINLATVKIQNFDKTITTIPTYALISDSFKNWRGMQSSDGRRIKRSVIIKQQSIQFLAPEAIEELKKIQLITDYLKARQSKIDAFNTENKVDKSVSINGRNMTNLGVFRKYVESYLAAHGAINHEMILMSRQLEPTTQGIPLEIYAFSSDKRWQNYEYIMADIFDHILAAVPYFKLEIFELPTTFTKN